LFRPQDRNVAATIDVSLTHRWRCHAADKHDVNKALGNVARQMILGGLGRAMKVDADVFVIGAGPAGLTAAYCLTKEAPSVIVIEKDPVYVGGISRTVRHGDYLFDIGGHRFFSKSKEVVDLWHEILPDDFIARPRLSRIYYGGKFYSYPLNAFEALRNLGVFTSAICMLSYAYARVFPVASPRSFHDWVRNQFGERLFQIFFKTYTEKVWGMPCDEISAD
jgi:protoporphyrinogen oxidase